MNEENPPHDTLFGFPVAEEPANQEKPTELDHLEVKVRTGPWLSPEGFVQLLGVTLPAKLGDITRVTGWPLHRAFQMCNRLGFGFSIPSHLIAGSVSSIIEAEEYDQTINLVVVLDESIMVFLDEEDAGVEPDGA